MVSGSTKKILSVSRERSTLLARNDALAIAGFSVSSPKTPEEAIHILLTMEIDVIVLGHSIPKEERMGLAAQFRALKPAVPIIVLFEDRPGEDEKADAFVPLRAGPEVLIGAIHACLESSGKKSA
ncbi:MAG TPA: hypothetical protein VMS96_04870 [Terriglobales bacterium]|nr:hypothetical protein [Terriglobales bacterium]